MTVACCIPVTARWGNEICCDGTGVPLGTVTFELKSAAKALWDPDANGGAGESLVLGRTYVATLGLDPDGVDLPDENTILTCPLATVDGFLLGKDGPPADGTQFAAYYQVTAEFAGSGSFPGQTLTYYFAPQSGDVTCDEETDLFDFVVFDPLEGAGIAPGLCEIMLQQGCGDGSGGIDCGDCSISDLADGPQNPGTAFQVLYRGTTNTVWGNLPGTNATDFVLEFGQAGAAEQWNSGESFTPFRLDQDFVISDITVVSGVSGDEAWPWIVGKVVPGSTTGAFTPPGGAIQGETLDTGATVNYVAVGARTGGLDVGGTMTAGYYVFRFPTLAGGVRRPKDTTVYITGNFV